MNENSRRLEVVEIIGGVNCVDTNDGHAVYRVVSEHLAAGRRVSLSFKGVERITTAFLNAAIGQLYNEFSEEKIRHQLKFEDTTPKSGTALTRVIQRAKQFFADQKRFNAAIQKALDDK